MVDVNGTRDTPASVEDRAKAMEIGSLAVVEAGALSHLLERELAREELEDLQVLAPSLFRRIDDLHVVLLEVLQGKDVDLDKLRRVVDRRVEVAHG